MKWLKRMSAVLLSGTLLVGSLGSGSEVSSLLELIRLWLIHRNNIRQWKVGEHRWLGGVRSLVNIQIGMNMWRKCLIQRQELA